MKRGCVAIEKKAALKSDLSLAKLKWKETSLRLAPKLQTLHEHAPDALLCMNCFEDMDKDEIERQHQTRARHHSRIKSLQSDKKNRRIGI